MSVEGRDADAVFETRGLTKFYGEVRGAEDISISVGAGEIFGFLGPNGAGKTTVIRCALGLLKPTRGEVRLFGDRVRTSSDANHERLGYLPAEFRLWGGLRARKVSDLLLGLGTRSPSKQRRNEVAERVGLDLDRRVKKLSMGNRQKIGLVLALQHEPDLLILDEPTNGLDPLVRRSVMDLLREFAARGGSIVYSSHNLNEVEEICSRVGILREGRLVALKTIEEIRAEREQCLEFTLAREGDFNHGGDARPEGFVFHHVEGPTWRVTFRGTPGPLLEWLARREVVEVTSPQISLEEAFLSYYRDSPGLAGVGSSEPQREARK